MSDSGLRPRGGYGIDAPWVPWLWVGLTAIGVVGAIIFGSLPVAIWTIVLTWYFGFLAVVWAAGAAIYWHSTFRGKFAVWEDLLGEVPLTAGAKTLDLGCGRGAVAIQAARRFPSVEVTGIDLWRSVDQSGNSIEVARSNAELNDVAERVHFDTGDMTKLPYADGTFSLVTASMSIHNIPTEEGRRQAVREAVRVLAREGCIVIADIQRSREYVEELRQAGLTVTGPHSVGWRMWWTGPWIATSSVTARR